MERRSIPLRETPMRLTFWAVLLLYLVVIAKLGLCAAIALFLIVMLLKLVA